MAFKAELLRTRLKAEGKTRKFLAEATKKTDRTVSRWLSGENPPKGKDLDLIARALKCSPLDFDPSHVDEGPGAAVHARVSAASHNAYEIMRLRYGVTQKAIIELAPVLFSIVASYALKVPDQDMDLHHKAIRRGLFSPLPGTRSEEASNGFTLDQRASATGACFGLPARNPFKEQPRNLFYVAMERLCEEISDRVSTEFFGIAEPGEAPSAAGFAPDVEWLNIQTGGDENLIKALVEGRIRLSKCWEDHQKSGGRDFPGFLRRELERANDQHQTAIEKKREESLAKLEAWRAFYAERHPQLAVEYDRLVDSYCHEDGWFPSYYDEELKGRCWSDPFMEERFINNDLLTDDQRAIFGAPREIEKRLNELKAHRRTLKAQFEELGK